MIESSEWSQPPLPTGEPAGGQRTLNKFRVFWPRFLLRRAVTIVVGVTLIEILTFFAVRLTPGDPVFAGASGFEGQRYFELRRAKLGLDHPWYDSLAHYVGHAWTLDFGRSFLSDQPVRSLIWQRATATLELAGASLVVCVVLATVIGVGAGLSATRRGARPVDRTVSILSGFLTAVPQYILAVALVYAFGLKLKMLPVAGRGPLTTFVLPVATLALTSAPILARIIRAETVRVWHEDYVRAARAYGYGYGTIIGRYLIPNILSTGIAYLSVIVANLIAGAVIVEFVFAWPGIGSALIDAVSNSDYPMVQGVVVVMALAVLGANLLLDLAMVVWGHGRGVVAGEV